MLNKLFKFDVIAKSIVFEVIMNLVVLFNTGNVGILKLSDC